ncbi:hypothetical protein MMEU_1360 [Mycobacterium marinum str. Europe]|nr:hypothetical protein MMEU_1360 [Mycobacterium marinum str. Europe]
MERAGSRHTRPVDDADGRKENLPVAQLAVGASVKTRRWKA